MSFDNNMLIAFERDMLKQERAANRYAAETSTGGLERIMSDHPDRVYPDFAPDWTQEADRKAGKLLTDEECQILQYARIAGVKPNATDYVKSVTAQGKGEPETVVKGPMMEVRYLAHWRKGYDSDKAAAARVRLEDKAMRLHFPYMLDSESRWRKPRTLKDGRIVYGRDKVESSVLIDRWRAEETAKQDKVDSDARRVREIELAELVRLQREDMLAAKRGRIVKSDSTMAQAFADAGITA